MVAGGAEAAICRIGIAGFNRLRALSTDFNDTPTEGLASLRQGSRRLRHGRGRRLRRAGGVRARQDARRQDLCRGQGLRPVGRCLSHHRAVRGRRRRLPRHEGGAEARQPRRRPDIDYVNAHGTSTPWPTRSSSARSSACSATTPTSCRCPRPSRRSAICSARPARSRRSSRSRCIEQIVPPTFNLDEPDRRLRHRSGAQAGQAAQGAPCAQQLLRLRRHQRLSDRRSGLIVRG